MGIFAKKFKKTPILKPNEPKFHKILMFFTKKVEYCKNAFIIKTVKNKAQTPKIQS